MIESIGQLPQHILGFRAIGEVCAQDYEDTIFPAVLAMSERLQHVRMLFVLDEAFTDFTAGALWDDAALGASRYIAWERVAVVSDAPWIRMAVGAMHFMMPGHFRLYHCNEQALAIEWLTEPRA